MKRDLTEQEECAHLNPVTLKIKSSFIRKMKFQSELHSNVHSLESMQQKLCLKKQVYNQDDHTTICPNDSPTTSENVLKRKQEENRANSTLEDLVRDRCEYSFIMERNKELQEELKKKNQRICTLGRRCQNLQMRLLVKDRNQLNNSYSLNTRGLIEKLNKTSTIQKDNRAQQLKSIQSRLNGMNFSRALAMISRSRQKSSRS